MQTRITRRGFTLATMAATVAASAALTLTPMTSLYANAPAPPVTPAAPANANPIILTDTTAMYDVMNGAMPKIPSFPQLAKKPGYLRGYVKNSAGKPLVGAKVMALSSAVGGFGSGTTGETNEQGYYEIKLPYGVARYWCAGYAVTYHGVRIANTLHPADGKMSDFDTKQGAVKNWVFLPYGIVDEASVSDSPKYSGGYYGASFTVGYWTDDTNPNRPHQPGNIAIGDTVEVTLTPQGPLIDGSTGRTIILRNKATSAYSGFQVNNVPVGRYTISAKLIHDGQTENLRLKENIRRDAKGGLMPKVTEESATVIFRSAGSDPGILRVSGGNMERLELLLERTDLK
jgi:hypothetical protein